MLQTKNAMSPPAQRSKVGGFTEQRSGTGITPASPFHWLSFLANYLPRHRHRHLRIRSQDPITDRDEAISLARLVLQKQKLGISLAPSQSLLLSREFLLAIKHDGIRAGN